MTGLFNKQIFNNAVFNTDSAQATSLSGGITTTRNLHKIPVWNSFKCNVTLFAKLTREIPVRIPLKATLQNQFLIKITLGFERLKKFVFLALSDLILDEDKK